MADTINNVAADSPREGEHSAHDNKKKRFKNKPHKKVDNYVPDAPAEVMSVTIEELELPEKTYTALKTGGVLTVGDIIKRRMTEMYKVKNIGKRDCLEIAKRLEKYSVTFREEEKSEDAPARKNEGKKSNNGEKQPNNREPKDNKNAGKKGAKDNNAKQPKREKEVVEVIDKDELVKFYKKGKWGFKDWQGKEVIAPAYDEAFPFREDLACVEKDEKLGYIDKTGEIVIPFLYDSALSFSEDLASVTIGEYSGYIDKTGEIVFPLEYDSATSFMDGKAIIKKDGRWGFLTKDGNIRWK